MIFSLTEALILAKNPDGVYERSKTWRDGHGWLNDLGGVATDENAPAWNSPYWTHVEGDPRLILDFEADSLVDADEPELPLSVSVRYLGSDVTLSPAIYYDWTRESQRGGVTDTLSDSLWNAAHKNAGQKNPTCSLYIILTIMSSGIHDLIRIIWRNYFSFHP